MTLVPGSLVGPYEIVGPLGAGGMGEVYRARDPRLRRDVALKILPEQFASDPERLARFEREATTLASLNHPNIAHIYGVEDAGNTSALVMELVEGTDLAERIRHRALDLDAALAIARQITAALANAHQAGITHRDLKPANIRLTRDGEVKVVDFGLATLGDSVEPGAQPESLANLPTTADAPGLTRAGAIVGTASYMSPEQARGGPVDKRTDIWAFGCVVYEMLTGRRAFDGGSVTEVLASVLSHEPNWSVLPQQTPDSIRRLLRRCLQKDPKERLHDITDARFEIDDAHARRAGPNESGGRPLIPLVVGAMLIAAAGAALAWLLAPSQSLPAIIRTHRITDMVGLEETPAISPDGRSLAFTAGVDGKRHVFVQLLDGGAPLRITTDAADHQFARWTPSASSLVFYSPAREGAIQGALWEIAALGGAPPRRLVDSIGAADVRTSDSALAYFRLSNGKVQLVRSSFDGLSVTVIVEVDPSSDYHLFPRWSPDGKWIAYQSGNSTDWAINLAPAEGGPPRQLTRVAGEIRGLAWLPDGSGVLYSSGAADTMQYLQATRLWRVTLSGVVTQLTSGEVSYVEPDVALNGAVAVSRLRLTSDIWKFPTDGEPDVNVRNGVRVTQQTGHVVTPTAAPGDREVAFVSDRGGHANLWVVDGDSRVTRRITDERDPQVSVGAPAWSPRGDVIAFVSTRGNTATQEADRAAGVSVSANGIWLVNPDGSNLRNLVRRGVAPSWSPDGRFVYFSKPGFAGLAKIAIDGTSASDVRPERFRSPLSDGKTLYFVLERRMVDGLSELEIHAATPEDGPSRQLATVPRSRVPSWQIFVPTLSPDGRWLAQPLTDGFTTNVWALSTTTGEWRQITDFGGRPTFIARRVSWSSDGRFVLAAVAEGDADVVLLDGLLASGRD